MVQLAKVYDRFTEHGAEIWAISPQTIVENSNLVERRELPFPVLADPDQAVIHQWGLFNSLDPKERKIPYPATYIIDAQGQVAWLHLGLQTRDRPTTTELIEAVKTYATR